ncbi:MAG: hypothetical protein KUG69_04510 [Marinosulfonomonas sp.]|nr:hypothetical protein [Marinosulfonomonas sp.]
MHLLRKREIIAGLVVAIFLIGLAANGLTKQLGAHPFWSFKVGYIGVGVGIFLYILQSFAGLRWGIKAAFYVVLIWAAAGVTVIGKGRFAASYAEDFIAGRMWYFGWIGGVALGFVLIVHLLAGRR